jgi:hypothetical protein
MGATPVVAPTAYGVTSAETVLVHPDSAVVGLEPFREQSLFIHPVTYLRRGVSPH